MVPANRFNIIDGTPEDKSGRRMHLQIRMKITIQIHILHNFERIGRTPEDKQGEGKVDTGKTALASKGSENSAKS